MQSKKRVQFKLTLSLLILVSQLFGFSAISSVVAPPVAQPGVDPGANKTAENFIYDKYYQIKGQKRLTGINLLVLEEIQKTFPLPTISYDRKKHFGGWINFADDGTCLDTRGLVLKRDSKTNVVIGSNCRVTNGDWLDPYTDKIFMSSSDIQIDHVVPLKNAYMTGAFEWDNKKRCQYANYLGNQFHLLSVNGTENMRKSDRSPSEYMPPNAKYTCEYLKIWLEIKYLWNLRLTPTEIAKIEKIANDENCDVNDFQVSQIEITEQKKYMKDHEDICVGATLNAF